MIKNYLKIALRSLKQKSLYTIINVLGLTSGLFCSIFIFNWVVDELSYDQHFANKDRIFRVVAEAGTGEDRWHQTVTSLPLGPTIKDQYPEVIAQTRLDKNDAVVEKGDKRFNENYIVFTDPDFFKVFDYELLQGNKQTALIKPYHIILTETMAKKYFGRTDILGETLKIYQYDPDGKGAIYQVSGVVKDPPVTSHFTFNFLASISTLASVDPNAMDNWMNNSYHTYILLDKQSKPDQLEASFKKDIVEKHMGQKIEEYDLFYRFYLQPVTSIYLNSHMQYEFLSNGSAQNVWIFSLVGLLIILLASLNYINLSSAMALDRIKEIGIRKVMGAQKNQLITQHLIETLLITGIAIVFAGLFIELLKPLYFQITGKLHLDFSFQKLTPQLLIIGIPVALISGLIPARLLARQDPAQSLKGNLLTLGKSNVRKYLVSIQFGITLAILIGLVVIHSQLNYIQSKPLGYDPSGLLVLRVNGSQEVIDNFELFREKLLQKAPVQSVARSGSMIVGGLGNSNTSYSQPDGSKQFEKVYQLSVDFNYLDTYGMELISGRNFSKDIHSDSTKSFVVNESFIESFGWTPESALEKEISFRGRKGQIIGVVKDFHYNNLHHDIGPLCMYIPTGRFSRITVKGDNTQALTDQIQALWNESFPASIFDYTFQREALYYNYESEYRFSQIFNVFSILSLLIALLGLFGITGFTVRRKSKELSIRKVLGASVSQLVGLISWNYLLRIVASSLVAIPLAWWLVTIWLESFEFRIDLTVWHFILPILIILSTAMLVIISQTIKPSLENPVNKLKEE